MSRACGSWEGSTALASSMLELVDCQLGDAVEQSYRLLTGAGSPFGAAITLALTIYVALLGFQLIFGRARLSIGDLAPRLIAIGVVLALATNWATYQRLVYDVLTNGPAEAARWVGGSADTPDLMASVDEAAATLVEVSDAWTKARSTARADGPGAAGAGAGGAGAAAAPQAPGQPTTLADGVGAPRPPLGTEGPSGPRMLTWSAILLLLIAAGPLLAAKIVLGLLLALGPLFILLALFGLTRGLAIGWLRGTAFLAIVPMLSALSTAGAMLLLGPMIDRILADAADDRFSTAQALGLFAGLLVLVGATLLLLRVAYMIASGWTIETRRSSADRLPDTEVMASRQDQAGPGALPRADQIAYAIERAAAAGPGASGPFAPATFRIEMPASAAGGAGGAEPVAGRRIGLQAARGPAIPGIRPLRAGEAR